MIGIDTNVLVRFLVRDNQGQFERARRLIKREVGSGETVLISHLVLLETEWVLRSRYGLLKTEVAKFRNDFILKAAAAQRDSKIPRAASTGKSLTTSQTYMRSRIRH